MIACAHGACYEICIVSESIPSSAQSTTSPDSSSNADLLEQLKTQLPDALFAVVSGRLNAYANEVAYSKLKIQVLEERLRLQRIEKYGPGSEKLSSLNWSCWIRSRGSAIRKWLPRVSVRFFLRLRKKRRNASTPAVKRFLPSCRGSS